MTSRVIIIKAIIIAAGLGLIARLFYIQLINQDYKRAAEENIVQKNIKYPYRGLIRDRNDSLLVYNTPVYDLLVVPAELEIPDTTAFLNLIGITQEEFDEAIQKARRYSDILSSVLVRQIPNKKMAAIQSELINYDGIYVQPRTLRGYRYDGLAHVLGYVGEISKEKLYQDTTNYYRSGDYIGISGIERAYEPYLRGERGVNYRLVDAQGVNKGKFREGAFDTLPEPGQDIQLTIDRELQAYAEKLMEGKLGSVVAIEPATGEILALVSSPGYDPALLSGAKIAKTFPALQQDTLKPLFNRALQAKYPPGSMFKAIQSLIALQEGVIRPNQQIYCSGDLIGDLAPPGRYDVERAIMLSSNNYFYIVFRRTMLQNKDPNMYVDSRIGFKNWRNYVVQFGLGQRLGIDLPNEASGFVPTVDYYDRLYGVRRWKFSNVYSLSIGQGELQVTPLQMANLGAIIANRGHYVTPHIVKSIENKPTFGFEKTFIKIDSGHYKPVINGMEKVVRLWSGRRAFIEGLDVCGKTSTVENPGDDHSGFMAFAPKDNPKIAVAVYVENAGFGSKAAAATAGLVIEKYLKGDVERKYMEDYVLKGEFK